ncbi:SAV_2336 N-terminal domain-related protein [Streptomyces tsukubensis]|uniref:SAV_2336 N-terminal domain-related protein n=1 Tax=Streptomyces tsukubensis TaxID=83656 RepID=UPI00344C46D6
MRESDPPRRPGDPPGETAGSGGPASASASSVSSADGRGSAGTAAIAALVARLREAELRPGAEELADALWLARYVPAAEPRPAADTPAAPGTGPGATPRTPSGPAAHPPPPPAAGHGDPAPAPGQRLGLYGPAQTEAGYGTAADRRMRTVPVPAPVALPDAPSLERSLRPLQRYRPPVRAVRRELDEIATADRAADTGIVVPVLTAVRRREARIALVMDRSSSNAIWSGALEELRRICERAGAFREVTVHRIAEDAPLPAHLGDPTGQRITVVLSDCAGPLWRSGRMQRLLHGWAATAPVCVVQPLPQRMWGRTHLPARPGLLRRREGPAGRLEFVPRVAGEAAAGIPVPVLAPRRSSFDAWTRLIAGATGQSLNAAAATVSAHHGPAAARPRADRRIDPAERVRAFRRTASPAAARLAVYLSAVPLVLPVMQLVQRAMLHRSGPDVLAEVLLSGLLRRDDRAADADATTQHGTQHGTQDGMYDAPAYAFLDGVRDELLGQLGAGSASLVLKHCSEYVESRYGRTVRNFPAMAAAFLSGAVDPREEEAAAAAGPAGAENRKLWAFAQVSTQVLRRLGGPSPTATPLGGTEAAEGSGGLAARARACLDHFGEHGTVPDLDTGIRLLGSAARAERHPARRAALYGELAEALLRRWYLRPVPEDLPEALDAAQNAVTGPPTAQLTLAGVLEITAGEVSAGRLSAKLLPEWVAVRCAAAAGPYATDDIDDPGLTATVLLSAADNSLAEPTEGPQRWDTTLRTAATPVRVRVLRRLAVTGAPYGPGTPADWFTATLGTAVAVVDSYVDETGAGLGAYPDPGPDTGADTGADSDGRGFTGHRTGRERDPARDEALLLRGSVLLELARHHRGEGPVPADTPDRAQSRACAERAEGDLLAGIDATDATAATTGAGARETVRVWLEYADAIAYSSEHPDDDARLRILQALDQARRTVDRDEAVEADILLRMGQILEQRYAAGGSWSHRDSVIAAWTEALPLLPWHDPGRAGLLTSLGRRLVERGIDKDAPGDIRTAVRHLRGAVDQTAVGDPALPERRALLGQAYLERFRAEGTVADLHEADWALGEAARTTADPALAATAWWRRAVAVALLARRTASRARLLDAAAHCRRAARGPREVLDRLLAAQWERAGRLTRAKGPRRALEEHEAVLAMLTEADAVEIGGEPEAFLRREIARLAASR